MVPPLVAAVAPVLLEADVVHAAVQQLVVEQGVLGYVRSAVSGDAQIVSAKPSAAVRMDSSPPSSERSTGKMNPRVPGWNKRLVVDLLLQSLI